MKRPISSVLTALLLLTAQTTVAQLTGTKTIGGTSPDYTTISAAIAALNANGTAAPGVTFLIRNGTYNETATLNITTTTGASNAPIVFKPDVGATVTVNVAGGATGAAWSLAVGVDFVTIDGSNSGGTSRDMTIRNTTAGANYGIRGLGNNPDCQIKNVIVETGAASPANRNSLSCRGIDIRDDGSGESNNFLVENCEIKNAGIGIRVEGFSGVPGIRLRNNTISDVGACGIFLSYCISPEVSRNTISVNLGDGSNSTSVYGFLAGQSVGIHVGAVTTGNARIFNNVISNVTSSSSTATNPIVGIQSTSTSTSFGRGFAVFNNFIYGVQNTATSGTAPVYGILFTRAAPTNSAGPDTVSFNSISLTGTNAANRNSAAIAYTSTTPGDNLFLRNNILSNTATYGTGLSIGILKSSTSTTLNSDYNDIWVGTPSTTRLTGRIGATNYQTMANWRTGSGGDANSVVENPPFTSATDLHIPNSTPTLLESGGVSITGQGFDIDDDTRSATAPDIGADEFNGIELNPPTITYSPLTNTASTSNRVLTNFATITDLSGVNTSPSTKPRIYYKKSTASNDVTGWKFTEATNETSPFSFTIDYSLIGGVAVGDVIQYFVVAQDLVVPTPNVGINSGTFASTPSSVALTEDAFPITGTINSYSIVTPLSTSLTVGGTSANYLTLTGAGGLFQAINNNVLGGNTTVTIIEDLTEPGTHALQEDGLGGFTLTIQPSGTRTVSGDVAGAMIDFNGADGVTINGLNSGGNSLTIRNTSTAAAATTIRFRNDATNNTITNCTVEGSTTNTAETAATIFIGGGITTGNDIITISNSTIRQAGTNIPTFAVLSAGSAGQPNDGLTVTNSNLEGFLSGIRAVTNVGNNLTITGNSLYQPTTITTTTLNFFDIVVGAATSNNVNVSNNFVGGSAPNATGTATRSAVAQYIGVFVTTGGGTNTVNNNVVRGVAMTSTGLTTQPVIGFVLNGTMTATGNLVQDISRASGTTGVMTGIQLQSGGNITLSNSTVQGLAYNATAATGTLNGISVIATGVENVNGCTIQSLSHTGDGPINGITSSGTVTSHTFNNNTIRALSGTNTGTSARVRGIISTAVGTLNITNNQVRNLTAATSATGGAPSTAALGGIITNATNLTQTITDNTVDTLNATNGTAAVQINGIGVQNTGSGGTIARNYVYRLSAPSSTGVPVIDGINVYDANSWTVANNVVSITNGTATNAVTIRGLRSDATSGTINFFYNSVFIGGSATAGSAQSFAFNRTLAGSSTINLRNNSLFNARTGGTGAHLAISRVSGGTFSSSHNVIFASANPTQQAGTPAVTDFAGWVSATGETSSLNQNPQYHSPLNLVPLPGSPNNNAGTPITVTTDILGATRSTTTPDIGAFEFTGATPTASGSATAPTWGAIPGAFLTINSGPTSPSSASVTAQFFNTGRTGTLPGVTNQAQEYWAVSSNVIGTFDVTFDLSGIGGVGNVNTIKLFSRSSPFTAWQDISSLIYDRQTSPNRLSVILASGFSEFSLGGDSDNPLPVNLSAFTGRNIAQGVELRWQTASETDNAGFEVRRTELINGVEQEWLTIASYQTTPSLAGQGTTSQAHNYTYTDAGVQVGKTYRYALRSVDLNGTIHDYPQTVTVEVNMLAPKVYTYKLEQNYPNPFNPSTRIIYQVAAATNVKLEVFDMLGRKVATLVNERKDAGEYSVNFNASGLSSGVYFYRLQTDKFTQTKKMILMK